jgi:hypothetical protein
MLKLYGGKFSRALIVHWYLEGVGLPYELVKLEMMPGVDLSGYPVVMAYLHQIFGLRFKRRSVVVLNLLLIANPCL